jgi:short-subunit dehydrogenase
MEIKDRLVLITGASSGIGAATAKVIAQKGGRVLLLARTQPALEAVAREITAHGGTAKVYPVDLEDLTAATRVTQLIHKEIGTPDILINNAGAGRWLFVEETTLAEAIQMMAVPYFAAFAITQAFLPVMLQRHSGHIVNVTSIASYVPWPGATGYIAARWAVRGFTEALRADLQGTGIGVTLLTAGKVRSPYWLHNPGAEERIPDLAKWYPTLTPEQVANAIVQGVERNCQEIVLPLSMRLSLLAYRLWPQPFKWLLHKTGWTRRS